MIYSTVKKILILSAFTFVSVCSAAINNDDQWRALDLNNTVLLTLPHGKVVIELTPQFAPKHVEQFSALVKKSFSEITQFTNARWKG